MEACEKHSSIICCAVLQMSRFSYKNWMNAATDLQRTQHMLLDSVPQCILRQHPRVQRWIQVFTRTTTMAIRRCDVQVAWVCFRQLTCQGLRWLTSCTPCTT